MRLYSSNSATALVELAGSVESAGAPGECLALLQDLADAWNAVAADVDEGLISAPVPQIEELLTRAYVNEWVRARVPAEVALELAQMNATSTAAYFSRQ